MVKAMDFMAALQIRPVFDWTILFLVICLVKIY